MSNDIDIDYNNDNNLNVNNIVDNNHDNGDADEDEDVYIENGICENIIINNKTSIGCFVNNLSTPYRSYGLVNDIIIENEARYNMSSNGQ